MCESPSTKCTKSVIPPTQMKSGFFSFCVFFFTSRVQTPTYKIVISPEKLKPGVLFFVEHIIVRPAFVRLQAINPEKKKHWVSKSFEKPLIPPPFFGGYRDFSVAAVAF